MESVNPGTFRGLLAPGYSLTMLDCHLNIHRSQIMRSITRIFVVLTAVLGSAVFGQASAAMAGNPSEEEQRTVQIVLYPAPEPRPALKYQLLPPFLERRPGNAAVWWNGIPGEREQFFAAFDKHLEKILAWTEIPVGDPREKAYREKELGKVIHLLRDGVFADMQRAAQFESCDWQLPIHEGNFIGILLPNVQHAREYARFLAARAHLEIAEGKYDQAVRTLQTGYAEARHVAQGPTIINSLVGVTIAGIMSYQVQQFIQQPDAPNLYWALSSLPRPLVDFRPGGEAESNILYLQFPELRDLDQKKLSPDEWRTLLNKVVADCSKLDDHQRSPAAIGAITVMSTIQGYPKAKRYLIAQGRAAAEVEAMPVAQVVLLYSVHVFDDLSADRFKWFFLPASETGSQPEQAEQRLREAVARHEIIPMASLLLLAVMSPAKEAETRCEWTVAMLRICEAMRLYAATHDGRWPDRLSDVTEVPIPPNPCDGKPFVYQRRGDKAFLTSEKGPKNWHRNYEITLKPKAK